MSETLWSRVAERLAEHEHMAGIERTVDRIRATGEVFTPSELVLEILQYCDLDLFRPGQTVLDPACGDGQFLVAAKWIKVFHFGMDEKEALAEIFGVDLMRDNVDLCRARLGGGTVVMGDTLHPSRQLEEQTDEERALMLTLFDEPGTGSRKKPRTLARKPRQRRAGESRGRHTGDGTQELLFG